MVTFIALLLLAILPVSDSAIDTDEIRYEEKLETAIEHFYQTDWIEARDMFDRLRSIKPNDPRPYFFESMMPFLEYFFVDASESLADEFFAMSEKAIDLSSKQLEKSPDDTTMVLMLSGLHGYRGLVAAGENRYRIAMGSGVTGFNYTRKLLSMNSDRPDARIGRGMFYYMVGSIPNGMRWASNIIGIRADIEDGFDELKLAAESESYIRNDAKIMLMYLYSLEERYEEALYYATELTNALPDNVIFLYKKAEILEQLDNNTEALNVYKSIMDKNNPALPELTKKSGKKVTEIQKITQKY